MQVGLALLLIGPRVKRADEMPENDSLQQVEI